MSRKSINLQLEFPIKGWDSNWAQRAQPDRSTFYITNMRAYDSKEKARGGQRPGLTKYSDQDFGGRIQCLSHTIASATYSGATALALRTLYRLAICDGDLYAYTTTSKTKSTEVDAGGTLADPPLSATAPFIPSARYFDYIFAVDGATAVAWDAVENKHYDWEYLVNNTGSEATHGWGGAGTFPINGSDLPRLLVQWRGRMVLSGVASDPHNWFMSAKDDPLDFDYSVTPQTETMAAAGNNAEAGKIGQPIMTMIPYNDDILIFGCDHSIWQMTGDPQAGGRLDLISDTIGMSWGRPWCKTPDGEIYFFGNEGGLYTLRPGNPPKKVSAIRMDDQLMSLDMSDVLIRLEWDQNELGVYIFVTSLSGEETFEWFYDARNDAFFRDQLYLTYKPTATHTLDGDAAADRVLLLGGQDGYIRYFDNTVANDDGNAIYSEVFLGPLMVEKETLPFIIQELQSVLGRTSDNIKYRIYAGNCSETSSDIAGHLRLADGAGDLIYYDDDNIQLVSDSHGSSIVVNEGTLTATRSYAKNCRVRGYSAYIKLYNDVAGETWQFENIRVKLAAINSSKGRSN